MIEKELKYFFDDDNYGRLKNYFDENLIFVNEIVNKNYFFDDENLNLYNKETTIRIRDTGATMNELTIKVPIKLEDNRFIKEETTVEVDYNKTKEIIDSELILGELINNIDLKINTSAIDTSIKLRYVGCLITKRQFYKFNEEQCYINLDESEYLGKHDYELEWEIDNLKDAQQRIIRLFQNANVKYIENQQSKYKRFIKELISQRKNKLMGE